MIDLPQIIHLPDEAATVAMGAQLARQLKAGDVIYLNGALGMGKSTLARGLIRALTSPQQDVPSPTFTLIQSYDAAAFTVLHLDLYRLDSDDEVPELGLDEVLAESVLLIEWPDRLGRYGYDDRLDITLESDDKTNFPAGRIATLATRGNFRT